VGNVARMGARRSAYRILVGRTHGKRQLGRPSEDGRIISKWTFKTWDGEAWNGLPWFMIGIGGGHFFRRQ
jgi:hypothetical protein